MADRDSPPSAATPSGSSASGTELSTRSASLPRTLLGRAASLLDALRGERWPGPRAAAQGPLGVHRSRRRGSALEFTEYRPYRQGDDPRRLDWKLLARTDRAYVRITDDQAAIPAAFVVDASASMAFPAASLTKWRLAQLITLGLAFVASGEGDPVELVIGVDSTVRRLSPTRRGTVAAAATVLETVTPSGAAALARPLSDLAGRAHGRVVIVSDFLDDDLGVPARARALTASGLTVHAVHIVASEELAPSPRTTLVTDPEDTSVRRPLTRRSRAAYLARFSEWRATLRQTWRTAGAAYVMATTDEPIDRIVRTIIRLPPGHA